jgi:hypothetical protein
VCSSDLLRRHMVPCVDQDRVLEPTVALSEFLCTICQELAVPCLECRSESGAQNEARGKGRGRYCWAGGKRPLFRGDDAAMALQRLRRHLRRALLGALARRKPNVPKLPHWHDTEWPSARAPGVASRDQQPAGELSSFPPLPGSSPGIAAPSPPAPGLSALGQITCPEEGCGVEMREEDWERHLESTCKCRRVLCPNEGCNGYFHLEEIEDHKVPVTLPITAPPPPVLCSSLRRC